MAVSSLDQKNYTEIERLEGLLRALRDRASTARETEAIREIPEIALAVREVCAMLVDVDSGPEQLDGRIGSIAG